MRRLTVWAGLLWNMAAAAQSLPDDLPKADSFSQADMYTHWIENRCLRRLGYGKALSEDAANSASAWLEFGHLPIEAYNQGDELIDRYLKIKLGGSVPGEFKVLQCTLIAATPGVKKIFDKYEAISLKYAAKPAADP